MKILGVLQQNYFHIILTLEKQIYSNSLTFPLFIRDLPYTEYEETLTMQFFCASMPSMNL